jgi:segregation and condensation protein B
MSLKAKIEAVIYASEEPVTLAQLMGLLGQEAQAELEHLESAQQSLALESAAPAENGGEAIPETEADALAAEPSDAPTAQEPVPSAPAPELPTAAATDSSTEASTGAPDAPAAAVPETPEATAERSARDQKLDEKNRERKLRDFFRSILDELIADYARESNHRGLEIREVAGGFRLSTKPQFHDTVRGFVKSLKPPLKLSLQALETLAVVAYKQPVTAPEVSEIRGVDSGGVLGSLMARKLVTTAGRKQVIGRPILYKTTRDFLLRFGLKDINELPSIEEFEKMAGELADGYAEPVQEEIPMPEHSAPETPEELQQEKNSVEVQADGDSTAPEPEHQAPAANPTSAPDSGSDDAASSNESEQAIGTVADATVNEAISDGRISGLSHHDDTDAIRDDADSPALDASVQADLQRESGPGEE